MKLPKIELYNSHDARNYFATTIIKPCTVNGNRNKKHYMYLPEIDQEAFQMPSERATAALQALLYYEK